MKLNLEKIGIFLLGAASATGIVAYESNQNKKDILEAMTIAIADGEFCAESTEEAEAMSEEVEEVYFVGCGGFF